MTDVCRCFWEPNAKQVSAAAEGGVAHGIQAVVKNNAVQVATAGERKVSRSQQSAGSDEVGQIGTLEERRVGQFVKSYVFHIYGAQQACLKHLAKCGDITAVHLAV